MGVERNPSAERSTGCLRLPVLLCILALGSVVGLLGIGLPFFSSSLSTVPRVPEEGDPFFLADGFLP